MSGIATGTGLIFLAMALADQRRLKAPLALVPNLPNDGTEATTAQIPPQTTTYEPIYLSDAQIAQRERVKNGTVAKAHDAVEADRVGL